MKAISTFFLFISVGIFAQNIQGVQLFNPKTNDETPVIGINYDQLVLRFDDLSNGSEIYRYTFKHYDRNWQDDNLFFNEFANGSLNALMDKFQYSFNTKQSYTHYSITFPNDQIQFKISGNYELIIYSDSADNPILKKRFYVVEDGSANLGLNITRYNDARTPQLNQRVEVQAVAANTSLLSNVNSISLNVMQNNNPNMTIVNQKPTSTIGNKLLFQQLNLAFPGNNEFYYFNNKNLGMAADMVAGGELKDGKNYTYLHPVWAYPSNYQYQPDVNGSFYFRRNDIGIERNPDTEGDYSWVYFMLDSEPIDNEIYVVGGFNNFKIEKPYKMDYDENQKRYIAKIYLKQGFYSYWLATKDGKGKINYGEINGSFWQTENLYQAFLYYTPFGRSYDGLIGYGEFRTPVK